MIRPIRLQSSCVLLMIFNFILRHSNGWLYNRVIKLPFQRRRLAHPSSAAILQQSERAAPITFDPPPLHYSKLPDETIYLLDATSMLVTSYFSREVASEFANVTAQFQSHPGRELPCGALVGLAMHFSRLVRDLRPKYIVAAFDVGRHTFRHELYKEYKAHRNELPGDLIHQFEYAIPVLQSLGCVCVQKKGYEADDVLATIAKWAREEKKLNVVLVSPDKDMSQLIGTGVHLMHPKTKVVTGEEEIQKKFGVPPRLFADFQALAGDSVDNIPGLKGVGPKIAAALVLHFQSIENLYSMLVSMDDVLVSSVDEGIYDSSAKFETHTEKRVQIKKKKGKKAAMPEEDVPLLEEIELATANVRCNPSKIIASMRESGLKELLLYRELSRLKDNLRNLDIIQPNDEFRFTPFPSEQGEAVEMENESIDEGEIKRAEGLQLDSISTKSFRYVGESKGAEEFFGQFGGGIFSKPLLSIRTQYNKLDISIKANGERGASEFTDGAESLRGVW